MYVCIKCWSFVFFKLEIYYTLNLYKLNISIKATEHCYFNLINQSQIILKIICFLKHNRKNLPPSIGV